MAQPLDGCLVTSQVFVILVKVIKSMNLAFSLHYGEVYEGTK